MVLQLMAWDEVQELLEYGALKEEEVKTVWEVSHWGVYGLLPQPQPQALQRFSCCSR